MRRALMGVLVCHMDDDFGDSLDLQGFLERTRVLYNVYIMYDTCSTYYRRLSYTIWNLRLQKRHARVPGSL